MTSEDDEFDEDAFDREFEPDDDDDDDALADVEAPALPDLDDDDALPAPEGDDDDPELDGYATDFEEVDDDDDDDDDDAGSTGRFVV